MSLRHKKKEKILHFPYSQKEREVRGFTSRCGVITTNEYSLDGEKTREELEPVHFGLGGLDKFVDSINQSLRFFSCSIRACQ